MDCDVVLTGVSRFLEDFSGDHENGDGVEEVSRRLQSLISRAVDPGFRKKIAWSTAVPRLVELVRQGLTAGDAGFEKRSFNLLLLVAKLLRNLLAGVVANQDAFRECDGEEAMARAAHCLLVLRGSVEEEEDDHRLVARFFSLVLQLLGNFVTGGERNEEAVWKRWFPQLFLAFCQVEEAQVYDPLCMLLFTCCRGSQERSVELCGVGSSLLVALLSFAESHLGYGVTANFVENAETTDMELSKRQVHVWLELLLSRLCLEQPLFPLAFTSLAWLGENSGHSLGAGNCSPLISQSPITSARWKELLRADETAFCRSQLILLGTLCSILRDRAEEEFRNKNGTPVSLSDAGSHLPMQPESVSFVVDLVRVSAQRKQMEGDNAAVAANVLRFALLLVRMLCAWESTGTREEASQLGRRSRIASEMLATGLLRILLDMLTSIGPPDIVKAHSHASVAPAEVLEGRDRLSGYVRRNPYPGYRRDIVGVLANLSYESRLVQDAIRENGGLLLILQQCVVDNENPFLREWGFWAMRNILLGNDMNQSEVAQLELQTSVSTEAVHSMGLSVDIDPISRRPKLVNRTKD